ncbi:type II toxin-antitoxin system HicB family antitoxin [Shewanella xiamenensis]|nr:type II toxin-antitoxin system HicB family antitoxin [Shewanella xiamenensis]MDL3986047.1 type II toxin-antitoxin system HicB family antitoxin [Shewanella xiamenensis]
MLYPIAIETGDSKHAYGVVFPDIPNCFSAGDTLEGIRPPTLNQQHNAL